MLSQELSQLDPGSWRFASLLSDKGRIRAVLRVVRLDDDLLIEADPEAALEVEDGLVRIAGLARVQIVPEARTLVRTLGNARTEGSAGGDEPVVLETSWGRDSLWMSAPDADSSDAAILAAEAARIRAGVPAFGRDLDGSVLVNETTLMRLSVAMAKGCYPGQESVARVFNLGSVRRRLCVLAVRGPVPEAGSIVRASGTEAGRITTSGMDEDGAVAFAMLESEAVVAGDLEVAGSPATVALS